jgi:membrane peptidoglycan carboxypeptidase
MSRAVRLPLVVLGALVASVLIGLLVAALAVPVVAGAGLLAKDRADDYLVLPTHFAAPALAQRSRVLAADGSHLAWLFFENRVEVETLAEVPVHTRQAVLAVEDARFYEHAGVDLKGTLRAAVENARSGAVQQGGSTLTQQYVKNALLLSADTPEEQQRARETTVERKLREARYAFALERRTSKDEILLGYLNIAYYGNGAHGIGTAAGFYFGKPVQDLTVAEGALLAGLVQSPGRHDPVRNPDSALDRRNTVLERMAAVGFLTEQQRAEAAASPLGLRLSPARAGCEAPEVVAPFFCDYVRRALEDGPLGEALGSTREQRQQRLLGGGLTIRTTLNPGMQAVAQRVLTRRILSTDPSGVAAVHTSVVPGTGEVRSLAVNRRYGEDDRPGHTKLNLALGGSSGMQAGSTVKPFVLAAALQQGLPLDTTFDSPASYTSQLFKNCDGSTCDEDYTVHNAGDSNAGRHDMVSGTHASVNTYYLQLLEQTGVEQPAALAEAMGLRQVVSGRAEGPLHRGGSFVLGANEVSPLDLSAAYAAFAARGTYCPPRPVTEIVDAQDRPVPLPAQECRQVLEPAVADTVTAVLRGTIDGPSPSRTASRADIGRPAAGKTGSTNGSKAAWFAGYVPQLASSVWVGKTTPEDMRDITIGGQFFRQVYGGTLPASLWADIMEPVLRDVPAAALPPHAVSRPTPPPPDADDVAAQSVSDG